jgi:hypothetical protein
MEDRRRDDPRIDHLIRQTEKIEKSIERMAEAVTKLAIIEERQDAHRDNLDRLAIAVEKIDTRLDVLERAAPENARVAGWVTSAAWSACGLVAVFAMTKVGLL